MGHISAYGDTPHDALQRARSAVDRLTGAARGGP
jgi:hypothetical protein